MDGSSGRPNKGIGEEAENLRGLVSAGPRPPMIHPPETERSRFSRAGICGKQDGRFSVKPVTVAPFHLEAL